MKKVVPLSFGDSSPYVLEVAKKRIHNSSKFIVNTGNNSSK
jgi:hypothetical protein